MPDREVKSIRDLIFYQYAKIIACSAFHVENGQEAKRQHYGFIKKTFRELKSGTRSWSEILREDKQSIDADKACVYCGATENLQWEHIVPKSLRIKPECATCPHIQEVHNLVLACRSCNGSKGTLGLYHFYEKRTVDDSPFVDMVPPLVEKKYLKTIFKCHECACTLDSGDLDGDGEISVLDIDYVIHQPK